MQRTKDTLFNGQLICQQHKHGYRFSVDAILLAHFSQPVTGEVRILDICFGSGVIGMILAFKNSHLVVDGLEIQPSLAELALNNIRDNQLEERIRVIVGDASDFSRLLESESYDLVTCNPPYRKLGTGRLNKYMESTIARHEITAGLGDFVAAAAYSVKNKGRVCFVYPAVRMAHLIHTLESKRLAVKKIQVVYSYPGDSEAKLVLVEAVKNGGRHCSIVPPLYIYTKKNGVYTPGVDEMYRS